MTDHEAEARMVADALAGDVTPGCFQNGAATFFTVNWQGADGRSHRLHFDTLFRPITGEMDVAVLTLARRLREIEKERDELRAERDGWREVTKCLSAPMPKRPSVALAQPADHLTGGYVAVKEEPAEDHEPIHVPPTPELRQLWAEYRGWTDAQDDFGRRPRRDGG